MSMAPPMRDRTNDSTFRARHAAHIRALTIVFLFLIRFVISTQFAASRLPDTKRLPIAPSGHLSPLPTPQRNPALPTSGRILALAARPPAPRCFRPHAILRGQPVGAVVTPNATRRCRATCGTSFPSQVSCTGGSRMRISASWRTSASISPKAFPYLTKASTYSIEFPVHAPIEGRAQAPLKGVSPGLLPTTRHPARQKLPQRITQAFIEALQVDVISTRFLRAGSRITCGSSRGSSPSANRLSHQSTSRIHPV